MTTAQRQVFDAYLATGRIAWYLPYSKKVSLNGGELMSLKVAIAKMNDALNAST